MLVWQSLKQNRIFLCPCLMCVQAPVDKWFASFSAGFVLLCSFFFYPCVMWLHQNHFCIFIKFLISNAIHILHLHMCAKATQGGALRLLLCNSSMTNVRACVRTCVRVQKSKREDCSVCSHVYLQRCSLWSVNFLVCSVFLSYHSSLSKKSVFADSL